MSTTSTTPSNGANAATMQNDKSPVSSMSSLFSLDDNGKHNVNYGNSSAIAHHSAQAIINKNVATVAATTSSNDNNTSSESAGMAPSMPFTSPSMTSTSTSSPTPPPPLTSSLSLLPSFSSSPLQRQHAYAKEKFYANANNIADISVTNDVTNNFNDLSLNNHNNRNVNNNDTANIIDHMQNSAAIVSSSSSSINDNNNRMLCLNPSTVTEALTLGSMVAKDTDEKEI